MEKAKKFLKENWLLLFAVLYLIVPTDFVPDILPLLGKTDDTLIFLLEVVKRLKGFISNEKS